VPNLSIKEREAVVGATTFINYLLELDDIWTEAVAAGPPTSEGELGAWIEQLRSLVDNMTELLPGMDGFRTGLSDILNRHHEAANATLRALLWEKVLDGNVREDLRWWVGDRSIGEVWSAAESSLSHDSLESEVKQLRHQLSELEGGQAVAGDLTLGFRCSAANGLLTGGILLIPSGIGAGIATLGVGALAAGAGFATGGIGFVIAGTALWWAHKNRC
jgi:hypothetical protein